VSITSIWLVVNCNPLMPCGPRLALPAVLFWLKELPPKAQHHRAWWSNNASNNVMTKVWLEAGYESARVDMSARKLVFRRVARAGANGGLAKPYVTSDGRHPMRGERD